MFFPYPPIQIQMPLLTELVVFSWGGGYKDFAPPELIDSALWMIRHPGDVYNPASMGCKPRETQSFRGSSAAPYLLRSSQDDTD